MVCNFTKNGGVEQVVYDLAVGLHEFGIDTTIVACKGSNSPDKLIETISPNDEVIYDPSFKKLGYEEKTEMRHYEKYRKDLMDFDIIHDHSQGKLAFLEFGNLQGHVLGTLHNKIIPAMVEIKNMVVISRIMKKWLISQSSIDHKIPIAYNGINLKNFDYSEEKSDRFLFFSEVGVFKGAKVAYEIARETGLPFDFAGKKGDMSAQIKQNPSANIRYYGEVQDKKKLELFRNAKTLIFPTGGFGTDWEEPFGLVMVEAMASGTPVIAAKNGAVPEIIQGGETGFICNSKEEMIEKMETIDTIKPQACRSWVEKKFSHNAMADAYLSLYRRILKGERW